MSSHNTRRSDTKREIAAQTEKKFVAQLAPSTAFDTSGPRMSHCPREENSMTGNSPPLLSQELLESSKEFRHDLMKPQGSSQLPMPSTFQTFLFLHLAKILYSNGSACCQNKPTASAEIPSLVLLPHRTKSRMEAPQSERQEAVDGPHSGPCICCIKSALPIKTPTRPSGFAEF